MREKGVVIEKAQVSRREGRQYIVYFDQALLREGGDDGDDPPSETVTEVNPIGKPNASHGDDGDDGDSIFEDDESIEI
jgi:hypothetical protein